MNPWQDAREIVELVKDEKNWTQELFDRCRKNTLVNPCIFNMIHYALTDGQYEKFDAEYCSMGAKEKYDRKEIVECQKTREQLLKEIQNLDLEIRQLKKELGL